MDEVGELVITRPLPSMPVSFCNDPDGSRYRDAYFATLPDVVLDDALSELVRDEIRCHASPRHVPDEIIVMESLPHTRTGKKIEVPLKRILQGAEPAAVVSAGALDDPDALAAFVALAERRRSAR